MEDAICTSACRDATDNGRVFLVHRTHYLRQSGTGDRPSATVTTRTTPLSSGRGRSAPRKSGTFAGGLRAPPTNRCPKDSARARGEGQAEDGFTFTFTGSLSGKPKRKASKVRPSSTAGGPIGAPSPGRAHVVRDRPEAHLTGEIGPAGFEAKSIKVTPLC